MNGFKVLAITLCLCAFASSAWSSSDDTQKISIALEALKHLPGSDLNSNPNLKAAVYRLLDQARGTSQFVQIVKQFDLKDQNEGLLELAGNNPASDFGVDAMRVLLAAQGLNSIKQALEGTNVAFATRTAEVLGNTAERGTVPLLLPLICDGKRDLNLRKQAVRALAQTSDGATGLLNLARADQLAGELKLTAAGELNNVRWPGVKNEASKILPLPVSQNAQPFPAPAELLRMKGDVTRGEMVFFRQLPGCASCHQVKGKGAQIGPDLSEIGSKLGKDAIIEAILDPNAGISVGYETYSLELKSGDEAYGLLTSDSADEIAIKDLKGIVTRYKKNEIASRRQLKTSIMPTGLQEAMTIPDFADLVEFLFSLKKQ